MNDFDDLDRFLDEVAAASDIKVVTLASLAAMLRSGKFEIRKSRLA